MTRAMRSGRDPPEAERGSVSVVATGIMAALVVMALATSDVARVLSAASAAQTAADAAAQELAVPTTGRSPQDAAAEYAARNGADLLTCDCPPDGDEAVVEVRAAVGPLLFFGSDRTVTARARAVVDRPAASRG